MKHLRITDPEIARAILLETRRQGEKLELIASENFASEVVFGSATEQELQPIIDGLALDESLLGGLIVGVSAVVVTLLVAGSRRSHRPTSPT